MTFVPIGRTQLQAGEALHMAVDARTVVHVTQGAVMLREPPAWLAQRVLMPSARALPIVSNSGTPRPPRCRIIQSLT